MKMLSRWADMQFLFIIFIDGNWVPGENHIPYVSEKLWFEVMSSITRQGRESECHTTAATATHSNALVNNQAYIV